MLNINSAKLRRAALSWKRRFRVTEFLIQKGGKIAQVSSGKNV